MAEKILARTMTLQARINKPDGLNEQLRVLFERGKREQLLRGLDARGVPFVPLAQSTLEHHHGSTVPLVPRGEASEIITRHQVVVTATASSIEITGSWPGLDWITYHQTGGRRLPQRDPTGFRAEDKAEAMRLLREWIFLP
jgi:hypothetical protein